MKVIKRVVGVLVVLTLCVANSSGVQAEQDAFGKAKQYYQQKEDKKILYADEILAIEAMGWEVEESRNGFDISAFLDTDYTTQSAATLGKSIIALCLVDQNPRAIHGVDLVALLESYYQEDGSFEKEGDWVSVGTVPFAVIALQTVGSTLDMTKTISYFTNQQEASGAFGYQSDGFHVEYASTAWAMLALDSLGDVVASKKAKQFLDTSIDSTLHGWNQYGTLDANNQASVLWPMYELGYTAYQEELQALLAFQCQDGSFGFKNNTATNAMATQQAMLALGVKYHGSIIDKAIGEYQETMTPLPKEATFVSEDGLVTITGRLPEGTNVLVEAIQETNKYKDILTNTLQVDVKQVTVVDISLVDAIGNSLQPKQAVAVKVKLPEGFSNETVLYHEQVDGTLVKIPVTIANGYVNFTTNSFSNFIFVEKMGSATPPSTKQEVIKTGDTTAIYTTSMIAMISLLGCIIVVKKKKKI